MNKTNLVLKPLTSLRALTSKLSTAQSFTFLFPQPLHLLFFFWFLFMFRLLKKRTKMFLCLQINSHHNHSFWLPLQNYIAAEATNAKAHLKFAFNLTYCCLWHLWNSPLSLAYHEMTCLCAPIMNITAPLRALSRSLSLRFWCSLLFIGQLLALDAVPEWNHLQTHPFLWFPVYGWLPCLYSPSVRRYINFCLSHEQLKIDMTWSKLISFYSNFYSFCIILLLNDIIVYFYK